MSSCRQWGLSEMAYFIFGYFSTKLDKSIDGHEKIVVFAPGTQTCATELKKWSIDGAALGDRRSSFHRLVAVFLTKMATYGYLSLELSKIKIK
jgi:hypothetical protein